MLLGLHSIDHLVCFKMIPYIGIAAGAHQVWLDELMIVNTHELITIWCLVSRMVKTAYLATHSVSTWECSIYFCIDCFDIFGIFDISASRFWYWISIIYSIVILRYGILQSPTRCYQIDTFAVNKSNTKKDTGKSIKNTLHVLRGMPKGASQAEVMSNSEKESSL